MQVRERVGDVGLKSDDVVLLGKSYSKVGHDATDEVLSEILRP